MGGDDITEFLLALLERIRFPYREADISRAFDWSLIEDLKSKVCTLAEVSRICFSCPCLHAYFSLRASAILIHSIREGRCGDEYV